MQDKEAISRLVEIVGKQYVFTGGRATERFRKGFRTGIGDAECVVQPGTLVEFWQVLKVCVANDRIVIFQAANTGLTEGSTPNGKYDRPVVIVNTRRIDKIIPVDGGKQVIALPGATLFQLEKMLAPIGREPHSVIGSSGIGSSIVGGICNNAGGSLINRGPSYTELALYARVDEAGELHLINHLGVELGETPEEILGRLEKAGSFDDLPPTNKKASDDMYQSIIRDVNADTPARYNNDKRCLHEVSGCAGKLAVFAVRLDTFEKLENQQVFFLGTNDTAVLNRLRRTILRDFETLPVSGEYMERELYDAAKRYGKDTVLMIDKLGTSRLPQFFALKGRCDAIVNKIPLMRGFTDKCMQLISAVTPNILPQRMEAYRDRFQHYFILKTYGAGTDEARTFLPGFFADNEGDFFECTEREGQIAGLHRFAAAGAAVRFMVLNQSRVGDILSLDIALRRNDEDWFEELPKELTDQILHTFYCGHLFCHVMHHDYVVKKGVDVTRLKQDMLKILDRRRAEYPSEHNVGHLYQAKQDLQEHYKVCDPTNMFNPGIGKLSRKRHYA